MMEVVSQTIVVMVTKRVWSKFILNGLQWTERCNAGGAMYRHCRGIMGAVS